MPVYCNIDGVSRNIGDWYANVGGAERKISGIYANADGAQKQLYQDKTPLASLAIGESFWIEETGGAAEYIVVARDYTSASGKALAGHTVICRKHLLDYQGTYDEVLDYLRMFGYYYYTIPIVTGFILRFNYLSNFIFMPPPDDYTSDRIAYFTNENRRAALASSPSQYKVILLGKTDGYRKVLPSGEIVQAAAGDLGYPRPVLTLLSDAFIIAGGFLTLK